MKKLILLLALFSTAAFGAKRPVDGPGAVPIGGMVAIMPNTNANAWQPPATGVIKEGFMRANGHTITAQNVTDGSKFPAGTVLPNMVGNFPKGANTSNAATGASKLVASNIPELSGSTSGSSERVYIRFAGGGSVPCDWSNSCYQGTGYGNAWTAGSGSYTSFVGHTEGHGHSVGVGTAIGSQTTIPDPVNVTVVWVIRVK